MLQPSQEGSEKNTRLSLQLTNVAVALGFCLRKALVLLLRLHLHGQHALSRKREDGFDVILSSTEDKESTFRALVFVVLNVKIPHTLMCLTT